jgi:hypothetical protein
MRAKKALKRLRKVEELLSIVIDEFAGSEPSVRVLLNSAKTSVMRAKAGINSQSAPVKAKTTQLKRRQTKHSDVSAAGRKRTPLTVRQQSIVAKRTPERKTGTSARSAGEKDIAKIRSAIPPTTKPAEGPLVPEALPEPNQDRHAN